MIEYGAGCVTRNLQLLLKELAVMLVMRTDWVGSFASNNSCLKALILLLEQISKVSTGLCLTGPFTVILAPVACIAPHCNGLRCIL